ncbi:MAG: hypothetical protein KDA60_13885 [Planctomycetales bacterium]|nr:hypothetical protein [Planctomycetales bacterium]
MLDTLTSSLLHVLTGGFAASALLIFSVAGVALGGMPPSCVRKDRRLPEDDDTRTGLIMFGLGAGCGIVIAAVLDFPANHEWLILSGFVGFAVGAAYAYHLTVKLNDAYMARARENLEAGHYREAIEDAREVVRSCERLQSIAYQVINEAQNAGVTEDTPVSSYFMS